MIKLLLRRHSLVARLLWFTLAAMTTMTVLIAVLVNYMVSHNRMEQSISQQQLINREIVQHIATEFDQRIDHLQRLAELLIEDNRLLPQPKLQALLDNRIGLHDAFNAGMILIGPDGHIQLDSPIIANRVGTDLSDRDHFRHTRDLRLPVVSRPLVGRAIKQPLYITSVPVQAADGRFLGSLAGINRLEADNTLKLMAARRLPQGGQLYVIDLDTELVVTSTRRSLIMAGLDSLANSEIIARVRAGQHSGVARSHFGHQAVYSAGTLERTGWLILTTAPVDYWMAPLRDLLVQISLLALVCLLLLGAVALVYLRYQLMPLKHAAEGVNRMRRDLSQLTPLPVYRDDEVGQCVEAFNGLLLQLQNRTAQLASSRDEAEEASRVKTEFLANMSHELRTPLAGVIGLAEIQLSRVSHVDDQARLNKILQSSRLLLAHLDAILTYVAAESGQLGLQCSEVMLEGSLAALKALHQHSADAKGVKLIINGTGLSQPCRLDQQALMQVLNSLMTNAIKFTDRGEVRLDVTLQQGEAGPRLYFNLSDTGRGIPELLQQKLFHTFEQIESGHSRAFSGIGVGLALSQKLVLLMGSDGIHVDSRPGVGSTFGFSLPVELVEGGAASTSPLPVSTARSIQVLVADDNPINREVAEAQLEQLGIRCYSVENGAQAVEAVQTSDYDLVLMDIQMPVMDGYEAARQIRAAGLRLPIVALTAATLTEDRGAALQAGMSGHLCKPLKMNELAGVISTCCGVELERPEDRSGSTAAIATEQALMDRRQRILIVDDEVVNLKILANSLKDDYTVQIANSGQKALELAFGNMPPDLILLDILMPAMDGYDVCRALKNDPATKDIPVIFVTALNDASEEQKGLSLGAVDYIIKPYQMPVVKARINTHLSLKAKTDLLEAMSYLDGLTHVPNRRQLDMALCREIKRHQRSGQPLGLVMVDIDYFKPFNDHYGHGHGDHCLQRVATALKQALHRPSDLLARYGGEEFVALLPETDAGGVRHVAERMRLAVTELQLEHRHSAIAGHVTVSLGGIAVTAADDLTAEQLLNRVDKVLYRAKGQGRNRVAMACPEGLASADVRV